MQTFFMAVSNINTIEQIPNTNQSKNRPLGIYNNNTNISPKEIQ